MIQRLLARENVDDHRRARFRASGITSHRQLLQRPLWDVAHVIDLSVCETEELVAKLSIRLAPASRTAFDLFVESANHPTFLRTGLPGIDQALNGGLHCRAVSESTTSARNGCCRLLLHAFGRRAQVETKISTSWLQPLHDAFVLCKSTPLQPLKSSTMPLLIEYQIVQSYPSTLFLVTSRFKEVQRVIHRLKIKLLIIDCVTTLYVKRQHQILRLLGDTWAHCITTRVEQG
uniref:Uncharacterized protein n=1 Tax=Hyaloperonospora arabidopsidis (strain Emoy2) TaxID=559515 RepID=M4BWD8_HYAAE